jgi:patatin-like phospholipase/acyl hydrolase
MKPFRVLAIDGGGIRGLAPIQVLDALERRAGKPLYELFDLVTGTSTGGILATGMTQPGPVPSAAAMTDLYMELAADVFPRMTPRRFFGLNGMLSPRYGLKGLSAALQQEVGDHPLGESRIKVMLPVYDIRSRLPVFFKSWGTHSHLPAWLGAAATSAAPTYFPPVKIGNSHYTDGGVFAPNPAMCGAAEGLRLAYGRKVIVTSLGTGIAPAAKMNKHEMRAARDWGTVAWLVPLVRTTLRGMSPTVNYELHQLDRSGAISFYRFDPQLVDDFAMDEARPEQLQGLVDLSREYVRDVSGELDDLLLELGA